VDKRSAAKPITAWLVGMSARSENGDVTFVVAGRVDNAKARTVEFRDPKGALVERPIGTSGFFVAALHGKPPVPVVTRSGVRCPTTWEPIFAALGSDGRAVLKYTVPLISSRLCATSFFGR
jgi:hypothetical protein